MHILSMRPFSLPSYSYWSISRTLYIYLSLYCCLALTTPIINPPSFYVAVWPTLPYSQPPTAATIVSALCLTHFLMIIPIEPFKGWLHNENIVGQKYMLDQCSPSQDNRHCGQSCGTNKKYYKHTYNNKYWTEEEIAELQMCVS